MLLTFVVVIFVSPKFLFLTAQDKAPLRGILSRFLRSPKWAFCNSKRLLSNHHTIRWKIENLNLEGSEPPSFRASPLGFVLTIFGTPQLRYNCIFLSGVYFFLSFAHYGISSWISTLLKIIHFGDPFATSVFYIVASIPGLVLALVTITPLGSRYLTIISLFGGCVAAFCFAMFKNDAKALTIVSSIFFNAFATSAWNAVDVFSTEIFPDNIRGTGLGIVIACGRVGSVLANLFNSFMFANAKSSDDKNVYIALITASVAMILAACCAFVLPNTGK